MRRWLVLGFVGLVIAVAIPVAWWATRPGAAGIPVDGPVPEISAGPSPTSSPTPTGVPATRPAAVPTARPAVATTDLAGRARLSIPSLGIVAPILSVGVRSDGTMAIPDAVQDVGWYKFGPAPGSSAGSAVIAGHVDNVAQGKGALFDLRSVGIGARITVTLASGRTVKYRVTGRESFVKKSLPTADLFARSGPPRLVLITCGGPFIPALHSYQDNLVVAAEPLP